MRLVPSPWVLALATLAMTSSSLALPCPPSSDVPTPSSSPTLAQSSSPRTAAGTRSGASSTQTGLGADRQQVSGNSTSPTPTSNGNSTQSSLGQGMAQLNGVGVGFLPDDGSGAGGHAESMSSLISALGGLKPVTYGRYAQIKDASSFDGSQLLSSLQDIKSSGSILEAAIMPTGGFTTGYSEGDTSRAKAIVKVLKRFTDEGIKVRLRFGHEVNYYLSDGTYPGGKGDETASAFKRAWSGLTKEVRSSLPQGSVEMFWTPNIESGSDMGAYTRYMPSLDEIDLCGVDWYPQLPSDGSSFGDGSFYASKVKGLYEACTAQGARWAVGETGLAKAYDLPTRLNWLREVANSKAKGIEKLVSISWFDYFKDYEFRIAGGGGDVALTKELLGGAGQ